MVITSHRVMMDEQTILSLSISQSAKIEMMKALQKLRSERTREPAEPIETPEGGITLGDASRKYKINGPTISRWVKRGHITVIKRCPNCLFLKETEVKQMADNYKASPGRGKRTDLLKP